MELSSCCPSHVQVTLMSGSFNESETHEIQEGSLNHFNESFIELTELVRV